MRVAHLPLRMEGKTIGTAVVWKDGAITINVDGAARLQTRELIRLIELGLVDGLNLDPNYIPAKPFTVKKVKDAES